MIRVLLRSICLLMMLICTGSVDAQIVRIGGFGGVRVRAPFVAVDVLPYGGGTRVRAPFTRVNTGGYRYGAYYGGYYPPYGSFPSYYSYYPAPAIVYGPPPVTVYEPVPVYPPVVAEAPIVAAEYPRVDPGQLAERLRYAAAQLAQSLALRRNDADVWLDYLEPESIVEVVDRGGDPSSLRGLVANYDGVVGSGSLSSIRSSNGFAETRSLLKQFVASAGNSVAKPPVPPPAVRQQAAPAPPQKAAPVQPAAEAPADALNPFRDSDAGAAKPRKAEPPPPPTKPVPPPPPKPAPPQASGGRAATEPINTATGGKVPTPL